MARDRATSVTVCVAGGHCETQLLPPPPALRGRLAFTGTRFTHVLPARVTRRGSAGPPVKITATLYARRTSVLTSQPTLGPVTMPSGTGRTCHFLGYWVTAKLRSDGVLGYHQFA